MAKRFHGTDGKNAMKEGSGMIHDAMSKPCNLPTEVIDKVWGSNAGMTGGIKDLYEVAQKQIKGDRDDLNRLTKPGKY